MNEIINLFAIDFTDSVSILESSGVYFGALIICITSCFGVKALIHYYQRAGRVDVPNQRSMHHIATPTGAGIVVISFLLLGVLYLTVNLRSTEFMAIAVVLFMLAFIGWRDDKNNLSVRSRMFSFVLLSLILVMPVGVIDGISLGSAGIFYFPYLVAVLLTVLGFIWLLNLYNFMDGMDGLAASQTIIASASFIILFTDIALFRNHFFDEVVYGSSMAFLCGILLAATAGFMVWNWSPAKIFLGDVGSLPMGGFFAICTIIAVRKLDVSLLSCILILGVFVFDASYTLIARLLRGEKVTEAHRSHIYQRLANIGVSHLRIVTVYAIKMLLSSSAAVLWELRLINGLLAGLLGCISVIFALLWVQWLERSESRLNH